MVKQRQPRAPLYGSRVVACLAICCTLTRAPSGKRLAPMLASVVPLLRRDGDIVLSDEEAALLVSMSAATIDRRLATERAALGLRGPLAHQAGYAAQVADPCAYLGRLGRQRAGVRRDRLGRLRGPGGETPPGYSTA